MGISRDRKVENRSFWGCLLIATLCLGACSSSQYLNEGETFLESNNLKIQSGQKVKNKGALKARLEELYIQEQTRTFMGIPRHYFYYAGLGNPDSTWFKRWLNTKLGDPPVITDSVATQTTQETMIQYLKHRGYWNASVTHEIRYNGNRASIKYLADPGARWRVDTMFFTAEDPGLQYFLDSTAHLSLLAPGDFVDIEAFENERSRITRLLQNQGYANFFKNYIQQPIADSSNRAMELEIEVLDPDENRRHQKYRIGEIRVYPDFTNEAEITVDTIIDNVRFLSPEDPFLVKPDIILRGIYIQSGEIYNRDRHDKTRQQLNKLETYSFVAVRPVFNPNDSTLLDFEITLSRNKKMGIGGDLEVNYSTLSLSRQNLIGLGVDLNYRNRNIFRGGELFTTSLETGIEFNLQANSSLLNSLNINLQNSLLIPRFIDPFKFYTLLNKIRIGKNGLFSDKIFSWIREDFSRINVGYQYFSLLDLYNYHSVNISLGYDAQPDQSRRLQINHFGIEFFSPTTKPDFDTILADNIFLQQSFIKSFFTGVLFKDYRFVYTKPLKPNGWSHTIIHSAEISGLEALAINGLVNGISGHSGPLLIGDSIPFAHFMKGETDTRWYKQLQGDQQLAFRAAAGVAFPYGPFTSQVPYVKQYYLGGPQSVRAWQIRELGPGGYEDPNVTNNTIQFYQTGDVKLEFSAEYRFKIGWIFNGAFFVDAGNVWTIKSDPDRPGAAFSADFLKQMAIGSGVGFRLDFKYFIIRWDLGYKIRNPFPDEEGKYWLWDNFNSFSFKQFNSNFAIGYPF